MDPSAEHPPDLRQQAPEHLVLLRGLARESGHWGPFISTLTGYLPALHVHALDLPGTGEHRNEASPCSVAAIADHVARRMPLARTIILGMSLGAMVALDLALRRDLKVAGLIAINTSMARGTALRARLSPHGVALVGGALLVPGVRLREHWILTLTSNRPEVRQASVASWIELAQRRPASRRTALAQLLAAATFCPQPRDLARPALWLASGGDKMVAPTCSTYLAHCFGGELACHTSAGHDLTLDDPEWCASQIQSWWQRHFRTA